jgi:glutamyl-tRNA(Gln) amidotransferase subunit E
MYPDTDLPPLRITPERLGRAREQVPKPSWEYESWYRELGVPDDLVVPLAISPYRGLFELAVQGWRVPPTIAAVTLVQLPKRVSKKRGVRVDFAEAIMRDLLSALRDRRIVAGGLLPVLEAVAAGEDFSPDALPPLCSEEELSGVINRCSSELSLQPPRNPAKTRAVLTGMVMNQVRGRIEGKAVAQRVADSTPEVPHE